MKVFKSTMWLALARIALLFAAVCGQVLQSHSLTYELESERKSVVSAIDELKVIGELDAGDFERHMKPYGYFRCDMVGSNSEAKFIECTKQSGTNGVLQSFYFKLAVCYDMRSQNIIFSSLNLDSRFVTF